MSDEQLIEQLNTLTKKLIDKGLHDMASRISSATHAVKQALGEFPNEELSKWAQLQIN